MKHRSMRIVLAAFLMSMSLACSTFTRLIHPEATPTFNYIFTPSLVHIKIDPASLPDAQKGVKYNVDLQVSDNVTPVGGMSISKGTLPTGLELVYVDGEDGAKISGTPEETGTFTFTVLVVCRATMVLGQSLEKEFQIVVTE